MTEHNEITQIIHDICKASDSKEIANLLGLFFGRETTITLSAKFPTAKQSKSKDIILPIYISENNSAAIEVKNANKQCRESIELLLPILELKLNNIELSGKINQSLNYNNAMKNIAKIIESQYELSYIIPLIGEIMDAFLESHLVYIFLKQNSKMKLVWPNTCLDENIHKKISKMTNEKETFLSKNKKIGYFPLINENNTIGCLATKSVENPLESQEIYQIQQLSKQIAITINRAKVYAEILKFATLDALTGFYNRHQLEERLKQEVSHSKRRGTPLCAIMTDIDFFKKVNDSYGHMAGDLVLKTVSKIIRGQLREYDVAARYGGEEFVILLPFTKKDEAYMVAERLRKAVKGKLINIEKVNSKNKTKNINVTISLGVGEYDPANQDAKEFLMHVDKALYTSKETGRDRVFTI